MKIAVRIVFSLVAVLFAVVPATAAADRARPLVLFDRGHGERFLPEQTQELGLSAFAAILAAEGCELRSVGDPIAPAVLDGAAALVVSGAFARFTDAEVDALANFVAHGGRLAVMLHVAPPLSPLLGRFGIIHSNGVIREEGPAVIGGEALNFKVLRLKEHPLFAGVSHFSLYGGWALALADAATAQVIAATGERAWVDLNGNKKLDGTDAVQSFGVVAVAQAGSGEVAIFGDDAVFQNRYLSGENVKLAQNLARWLKE